MTAKLEMTPSDQASTNHEHQTILNDARRARVLDILEEGRKRISTKWITGDWQRNGGVCALGALGMSSGSSILFKQEHIQDAVCFLYESLPKDCKHESMRKPVEKASMVMNYNDSGAADKRSIVKLFDAAIDLAKNEPFGD